LRRKRQPLLRKEKTMSSQHTTGNRGGDFTTPVDKSPAETTARSNAVVSHSVAAGTLSPEERHHRICVAAYRRSESRGFQPDGALEDWLLAEREIDSEIND
jgi:hypothetical protein